MSKAIKVPMELELKPFEVAIRDDIFTDYIGRIITNEVQREQFMSNLIIAVNEDPELLRCEKLSIVSAGLEARRYNLTLGNSMGHAHLVPYNDRRSGTKKAQFQIGYKGLVQLALRTGRYLKINVTDVREGELESIDYLLEEHKFKWLSPEVRKDLDVIGYAAVIVEKSGFNKMVYFSKEEVEAHAGKYSQAYKSGKGSPWTTEFDKMAKKTVLKLLLSTYGQITPELQQAIDADQAVVTFDEEGTPIYDYVDVDESRRETKPTGRQAFESAQGVEVVEAEEVEVVVEEVKETPKETTDTKPKVKPTTPKPEPSNDEPEDTGASASQLEKLAKLKARRGRPPKTETPVEPTVGKPKTEPKVEEPKTKVKVEPTTGTTETKELTHAEKLAALKARWKK